MSFPADLYRGQLWTTSVAPYKAPLGPDGKLISVHVATCHAVDRHGVRCYRVIEAPWEDIPRVQDGLIVHCLPHRGGQLEGYVPTADEVARNTATKRAQAEARWAIKRAA